VTMSLEIKATNERNHWVDYAKCIGIILVVYGHIARGVQSAGIDIPQPFYEWADSVIYTFHMPLFFFLSGLFFFSSFKKKGVLKFSSSKIDTVFYPYVVWSVFQGSIGASLFLYTNGAVSHFDVFGLLVEPIAQFWFLYSLFFIFIVVAVVFFVFSCKAVWISFLLSLVMYLSVESFFLSVMVTYVFDNTIFFVFGIIFSRYLVIEKLSTPVLVLCWLVLFVLGQYVFHLYIDGLSAYERIARMILVIISLLLVVSVAFRCSLKPTKWIMLIGSSSMGIYVMHILAGSGVRIILSRFLQVDSYLLHLVVGVIVAVIAPIIFLILLQKYRIGYVFSAPISLWVTRLLKNKKHH
jgi:fucose 4-O-acetylase-like acetyltransferase